MKTHKAYRIDAYRNVIEEVKIESYKDISKHIGCDLFCVASHMPNNDTLYVDDEGYLNEKVTRGFMFNGRFYAGNGLLLGSSKSGDSANAKSKELDIANLVMFAPVGFQISDKMRDNAMSSWTVTML